MIPAILTQPAAVRLVQLAQLQPGMLVFQASSCPVLANAIMAQDCNVHSVKPGQDFLAMTPSEIKPGAKNYRTRYDRIVMAAPVLPLDYRQGQGFSLDIQHVERAITNWLAPGGILAVIFQRLQRGTPIFGSVIQHSGILLRDAYQDRLQIAAEFGVADFSSTTTTTTHDVSCHHPDCRAHHL